MAENDLSMREFFSQALPDALRAFDASTLTDLDLAFGDLRLTFRRAAPLIANGATAPTAPERSEPAPDVHVVTAQMVGTFYLTPAPGKPPMVREGDVVEKGQVIGIIEAMKVMNELESEFAGRVTKIFVKNQEPVEFGQPLMHILPE